jgi:hypothetical protein
MLNRPTFIAAAGRLFKRLAGMPTLCVFVVGVLAFVLNAAISLTVRMPVPAITDEFSYLLAADTYAHGRLTNPTHPFWVHFESVHIIQQPSYASKFPPAQGLVLGLGQVVFGQPIVGVWISAGLACAVVTWMLAGWLPPRWALVGGLIAAVHPLVVEWGQNYWGGLVPMAGGSLVLGAFRRIVRRPLARHGFILGIGLAILANSRPFEGLLLSLPVAVALGIWTFRQSANLRRSVLLSVVLPVCSVLAVTIAGMLYYNRCVTGDPLTMPYQVHERQYGGAPLFLFLPPKPLPTYRHQELEDIQVEHALAEYEGQRTPEGLVSGVYQRLKNNLINKYLVSDVSLASLVILVGVMVFLVGEKDGWLRFAMLTLLIFIAGLLSATYTIAHYAAPAAGLMLLLLLQAMRRLRTFRWQGRRIGRPTARLVIVLVWLMFALLSCRMIYSWDEEGFQYRRAEIVADLASSGEQDLVIVRYAEDHNFHHEWVYNEADIDAAPVVWARELDRESDGRLIEYFKDRKIWLLEPDRDHPQPVPYSG